MVHIDSYMHGCHPKIKISPTVLGVLTRLAVHFSVRRSTDSGLLLQTLDLNKSEPAPRSLQPRSAGAGSGQLRLGRPEYVLVLRPSGLGGRRGAPGSAQ